MELEELLYQALKSVEPYSRNLVRAYGEAKDAGFRTDYQAVKESCKFVILAIETYEAAYPRREPEKKHLLKLIAETPLLKVLEHAEYIAKRSLRDHPHDHDCLTAVPLISALLARARNLARDETNT